MTSPLAKVPHALSPVTNELEILPAHIAGSTWAWAMLIVWGGHDAGSATATLCRLSGILQ
jgi:hypothetical protein